MDAGLITGNDTYIAIARNIASAASTTLIYPNGLQRELNAILTGFELGLRMMMMMMMMMMMILFLMVVFYRYSSRAL